MLAQGGPYTWDNLVQPLEEMEECLSRTWAPVAHMNAVVNNTELRSAYNACLARLSDYATELAQHEGLCAAYQAIAASPAYAGLNVAQRKVIENNLRDFRLAGVALPTQDNARFKAIAGELAQLSAQFDEHLLDATQAWHKLIADDAALAGLPASALALLRQNAERAGEMGYRLSLEFPCYIAVMTYAQDRALRREMHEAYVTRASDIGPHAGCYDNSTIMERSVALRHEQARLVGFSSYADYSLATKMAQSPDEVLKFLHQLAARARPAARREMAELEAVARRRDRLERLESWDTPYYAEQLRQENYALSQEDLRPYFPEPHVVSGLFAVVKRLYGLRIEQRTGIDVWHPDVRFFDIHDRNNKLRGQFYLDLYARTNKRGGAWMDECRARQRGTAGIEIPVAFLTCNFSPPLGDDPALLTHEEVETLFHEFGHGLHHLLTRVDYPSVAGISGVPWDAVELPSQFMEHWCWERQALDLIAAHYRTGEALPDTLYQRLQRAKNFHSALQTLRQLEFSLFDFRLHLEYDPARGAHIQALLKEVRDQLAVVKPPAWNRFAHGFSHIFAGGYAAGYYSYKWAEVLSSDAFSAFEEQGIFDRTTGERFLTTILEQGGTREPMELFMAFRGREPSLDALLRHSGFTA